ncbi:MAG: OsmC family protein [Cocleimonas sp.]|nr:OsmC family protein [Cocleimonas sp.]
MKSRVKWLDNMSFVGESASGHSIVMDGPPEAGGRNLGVRPMEMLLLGLGGCASFDIVSMLQKGRQDITNCEVEISAKRADGQPKVFTEIHLHFIIEGNKINESKVARAITLSAEKYCSASIMLGKTAVVTHDYEIT